MTSTANPTQPASLHRYGLAEVSTADAEGSAVMGTENADSRAPYADQRKQRILDRLRSHGRVEVLDIAEGLGVTGETIRKDLIALERQGLLRRVHGGAVPAQALTFEPAVETRTQFMSEKTRIARAALGHLPEQGSVLIDAGSTTAKLVEMFPGDRELTVYTNTVPLAMSLLNRPRLTVFTLGGRLAQQNLRRGRRLGRPRAGRNQRRRRISGNQRHLPDARSDHPRPRRSRRQAADAGLRPAPDSAGRPQQIR